MSDPTYMLQDLYRRREALAREYHEAMRPIQELIDLTLDNIARIKALEPPKPIIVSKKKMLNFMGEKYKLK